MLLPGTNVTSLMDALFASGSSDFSVSFSSNKGVFFRGVDSLSFFVASKAAAQGVLPDNEVITELQKAQKYFVIYITYNSQRRSS